MNLMYQQYAHTSHTSPKVAASPHPQTSPLPSPAHYGVPSPHGGDTSGSDAGDGPLNLSKPRHSGHSSREAATRSSSAAGSPSPNVQPPPAHSNHRLPNQIPPPDLGVLKGAFPPGFVPNPYLRMGHAQAAVLQAPKPHSPPATVTNSKATAGPPLTDRVSYTTSEPHSSNAAGQYSAAIQRIL